MLSQKDHKKNLTLPSNNLLPILSPLNPLKNLPLFPILLPTLQIKKIYLLPLTITEVYQLRANPQHSPSPHLKCKILPTSLEQIKQIRQSQ
jgi:hypothetical protein